MGADYTCPDCGVTVFGSTSHTCPVGVRLHAPSERAMTEEEIAALRTMVAGGHDNMAITGSGLPGKFLATLDAALARAGEAERERDEWKEACQKRAHSHALTLESLIASEARADALEKALERIAGIACYDCSPACAHDRARSALAAAKPSALSARAGEGA